MPAKGKGREIRAVSTCFICQQRLRRITQSITTPCEDCVEQGREL